VLAPVLHFCEVRFPAVEYKISYHGKSVIKMSTLSIETEVGRLTLILRTDAAPITCEYICKCAEAGLYDGTSFYRSDFVIQGGNFILLSS